MEENEKLHKIRAEVENARIGKCQKRDGNFGYG